MAPVAMATASDIVIERRQSLAASRDRGIHRAISRRIPGRSASGEPGPIARETPASYRIY